MRQIELTEAQAAELERVRAEMNAAIKDSAEDSGMEEDQIYGDIVEAVCWEVEDLDVARELCRTELGYVPSGLEARLGKMDWLDGV